MPGIIYILTNEAMHGYIKTGKPGDLATRVKDLYFINYLNTSNFDQGRKFVKAS